MKAIKIIIFVFQGLFVLTQSGIGQQSFFNISDLQNSDTVELRIPFDSSSTNNSLDLKIVQELVDSGYFDVELDSTFREDENIVYKINLGQRYKLTELFIQSNIDTLRFHRDEYFDVVNIKSFIQGQLSSNERNGYAYSTISVSKIEKSDENTIKVYLNHELGPLIKINSLFFNGNQQLSDAYLVKLTRFDTNSIFSPSQYSDIEITLRNSLFIQDVRHLGIIKQKDEYYYGFEVTETRSSSLDLIVGYEPDAAKGSKFVGNGSLRLINLFSEGSLAWLEFQKLTGSDSRLNFEYDQFWFNRVPVQVGTKFRFTQRDSSYQKISTRFSTSVMLGDNYSVGAFAGYNSTRGVNSNVMGNTANNGEIEGGISLEISDLDRRISPTNGYIINIGLSTGLKKIHSNLTSEYPRKRFAKQSINLSTQVYRRVSNQVIFTSTINTSYLKMDQYFDDDLFVFGGTKSMRGYREEQFRSSSYVWGDTELRYLIDDISYLFVFGAVGYHQYPIDHVLNNQLQANQLLYSSGFGLNYKIRIGLLKLTYAVGSQDQLMNGKVHFGITNFF